MKTFVVLLALIGATLAAPPPPSNEAAAETLKSNSDVGPTSYSFEYETSNQIKANEAGQLKQVGSEQAIAAQGAFSYVAPDGTPVALSYVADENGFQPQGDQIPVAPAVPQAILNAIEYIRANPPSGAENGAYVPSK